MATKIEALRTSLDEIYASNQPNKAEWADYLWNHHVPKVVQHAIAMAGYMGANREICHVAALLHDCGDAVIPREHPNHGLMTVVVARSLLMQHDLPERDYIIEVIMSHRNPNPSSSPEVLVLAAADAIAHIESDFYFHAAWQFGRHGRTYEEFREWALAKVERDFREKITSNTLRQLYAIAYAFLNNAFGD